MSSHDIVIGEAEYARINTCLLNFLRDSEARCALLVDRDGQLLARQGFTQNLDTVSLSALAAGAIASTQAIAQLVGEPEFSVLFHQGKHDHIHFHLVGQRAILMSVFDNATTIGLIRLVASKTAAALAALLEPQDVEPLSFQGSDISAGVSAQLDRVMGADPCNP